MTRSSEDADRSLPRRLSMKILADDVKDKQYVLLFDEALNSKAQHKQLDVHIRFWSGFRLEQASGGRAATIIRIRCMHDYSAEYEYTIRLTTRIEYNTNRIFGTALTNSIKSY